MKKILQIVRLFFLTFCLSACANTDVHPQDNYNAGKDTVLNQVTTVESRISNEEMLAKENYNTGKDTASIREIAVESNITNEERINPDKLAFSVNSYTNSISSEVQEVDEENIKVVSEIYTTKHTKDGKTYYLIFQRDEIPLAIAHPNSINDPIYKDNKSILFSKNYIARILDEKGYQLQIITLEDSIPVSISFEDVNLDGYMDIVVNTGGTINETHVLYIWDFSSENFIKVIYEGFDMLSWFTPHQGYIENFIRGDSPETSIKQNLIWKGNILIKESE